MAGGPLPSAATRPFPPQQACGRKLMEPGPTIDSLIEYLLSAYYEPDTALSTGTAQVKELKIPALWTRQFPISYNVPETVPDH